MKIIHNDSNGNVEVRLSRSNLQDLLDSLDDAGRFRGTATLLRRTEVGVLVVTAEEDAAHYADRQQEQSAA